MNDLDDLLRTTFAADAATVVVDADLTARSMAAGRRIRRRRRLVATSTSVLSVGAILAGTLAVTNSTGNDPSRRQVVTPAAPDAAGNHHGGAFARRQHSATASAGPWTAWPAGRTFGASPGAGFLDDATSAGGTVFASGTMTDGTDFVVYGDRHDGNSAQFLQGWNGVGNFGEGAGEAPGGADATYLTAETPTFRAGEQSQGNGQWLIVVARPGTVSASYSADGVSWQPMQVHDGIAVTRLPGIAPRASQIRLSDDAGRYVDGPLALP